MAAPAVGSKRVHEGVAERAVRVDDRLTVCDRTDGLARVVFSEKETQDCQKEDPGKRAYEVFVGDKKVASLFHELVFIGTKKFTFERVLDLIQLTEEDEWGDTYTLYVDPQRPADFKLKEGAHSVVAFPYLPCKPTLEEVVSKLSALKVVVPTLKVFSVVYNRHGVAVFGRDQGSGGCAFYWAKPGQAVLAKVNCSECDVLRCFGGSSKIANAKDGSVRFSFNCENGVYLLNGERAEHLDL